MCKKLIFTALYLLLFSLGILAEGSEPYREALTLYNRKQYRDSLMIIQEALDQGAESSEIFYLKGLCELTLGRNKEAVVSLEAAYKRSEQSVDILNLLARAYYRNNQKEESLKSYLKVSEKVALPEALVMVPRIYREAGKHEDALKYSYSARDKLPRGTDSRQLILYNIGLQEYLYRNYGKAEKALLELLKENPEDYRACEKLIQIYYASGREHMSQPWKEKLYDAWKRGDMTDPPGNSFCFDQFTWNNYRILVRESFSENSHELNFKHIFYIQPEEGNLFIIETETLPESFEKGVYTLGMIRDRMHYSFGVYFQKGFYYYELKGAVLDILRGKITPE